MAKKKLDIIKAVCIKNHVIKDAGGVTVMEFLDGETYDVNAQSFYYLAKLNILQKA